LLHALRVPRAYRALDGYTLHDTAENYLKIAQAIYKARGIATESSISALESNESSM
jgi:hypothetical protein